MLEFRCIYRSIQSSKHQYVNISLGHGLSLFVSKRVQVFEMYLAKRSYNSVRDDIMLIPGSPFIIKSKGNRTSWITARIFQIHYSMFLLILLYMTYYWRYIRIILSRHYDIDNPLIHHDLGNKPAGNIRTFYWPVALGPVLFISLQTIKSTCILAEVKSDCAPIALKCNGE